MAIREALTGALSLAATARHMLVPRLDAGGRGVTDPASRTDGWVNVATGLGTSRDKTGGTYYSAPAWLSDAELADLYNYNDLAAKRVDIPIREAFKSGYKLCGLDDQERLTEIERYLKAYDPIGLVREGSRWADLFGGSVLWFRFADGQDPAIPLQRFDTPFPPGPDADAAARAPSGPTLARVDAIEVVDRRFLHPFRWYTDGPKAGRPMTYQLFVPRGGGVNSLMGEIHESRLIKIPGSAPTEALDRLRRQGWNQSVLQRPYEALQASGIVWKAIDILVADANQAVYSIAGLWRMITADPAQAQDSQSGTGTPSGGLLNRIRFMDLMRSVSRAIVLDKDDETFERKPTTFTGLPELSERQWVRVSAAFDIPLPLLTGEYPSGLQSTGEGPFRVFYANVAERRETDFGPRLLDTIKMLLSAEGAPQISPEEIAELSIEWLPLWEPTALELADISLKRAQEGDILVQAQAITPEELLLSLPEAAWPAAKRELREAHLDELEEVPSVTTANKEAEQADADREAQAAALKAGGKPGGPPAPGKPPKVA